MTSRQRVVAFLVGLFWGLVVTPSLLGAQVYRYGDFMGPARDTLRAAMLQENERAWCVMKPGAVLPLGQGAYWLLFDSLQTVAQGGNTPGAIEWIADCPKGAWGYVHTHAGSNFCPHSPTDLKSFRHGIRHNGLEMDVTVCLPSKDGVSFAFEWKERQSRGPASPRRLYALLAVGVVANAVTRFDRDRGGYVDTWGSQDKQLHAAVGFGLVSGATMARVRPWAAAAGVCLAAALYEPTQGFVSSRDIAAGCGGAVTAALWARWHQRVRTK